MKMIRFAYLLLFLIGSAVTLDRTYASPDKIGVIALSPAVSYASRQIAFAADFDRQDRIWVSSLDGSNLRRISSSDSPSPTASHGQPAWSPDGQRIAYSSIDDSTTDIWVMQANGTYPVKLTNGGRNRKPAWSPDGRKIAFVSNRSGTNDIWIMNADGSKQTKLVVSNDQENAPSFSPGSDQIVYSKNDGDTTSLMIVNTTGTGLRTLTSGNFHDWEANWNTRGILFSSNRGSRDLDTWKIWEIQPDGANLRQVGDVAGLSPSWLPDGRILFMDEGMPSKALSSISAYNPNTGLKQVLVDVQGYTTPIDIRPGKPANLINPRSLGKVQVAILSTRTFDATKAINQRTLTFGRTGAESSLASCNKTFVDVNGDGIADLVCRFDLRYASFQTGDKAGVLRFTDVEGVPFEGRDAITTVTQDDPDDFKN
jgi:dipeptidyl aminopeptidase/acylaminoacyl peptidase